MALQGTIDSFPLIDVLQLLSSSSKTGRLELVGDRGRGALWVTDGQLVAGSLASRPVGNPAAAVWELLRFSDGSFEFLADEQPTVDGFEPASMDSAVGQATSMFDEWSDIEKRVPNLESVVSLSTSLPGEDVRLTADDWAIIAMSGPAPTVGDVIARLDQEEFEGSRRIAEMVDRGLLAVEHRADTSVEEPSAFVEAQSPKESDPAQREPVESEPAEPEAPRAQPLAEQPLAPEPAVQPSAAEFSETVLTQAPPAAAFAPAPAATAVTETAVPIAEADVPASTEFPERFPIDDLLPGEEPETWASTDLGTDTPIADPTISNGLADSPAYVPHDEQPDSSDGDDVLAQIGRLSPKAAEAIAAALGDGDESAQS